VNLLLVIILVLAVLFPIEDIVNRVKDPTAGEVVDDNNNFNDDEIVQIGDEEQQEEEGEDEELEGIGAIPGVNTKPDANYSGGKTGNGNYNKNNSVENDSDSDEDDEEANIIDNGIDNDIIDKWDDNGGW